MLTRTETLLLVLLGTTFMLGCAAENAAPVAGSGGEPASEFAGDVEHSSDGDMLSVAPSEVPTPGGGSVTYEPAASSDGGSARPAPQSSRPRANYAMRRESLASKRASGEVDRFRADVQKPADNPLEGVGPGQAGDRFEPIEENAFQTVASAPLSTFSIDVDTASYTKTRRYLSQNNLLPPPDAVRIEEFVNYFDYDYPSPDTEHPFAVHVETADCPWMDGHRLARIGIQGRRLEQRRPPSNLVFLIDVSGSMDYADKLPLVKQSLRLLASRLDENDRVSIVVYASAAGLVLPTTHGDQRQAIEAALERLHAGGSTNGGEGIHQAYNVALENYLQGGVNRVLLCTDGDFNVGTTGTAGLVRLAEKHAKSGVFLSVLAFGQGNHNDAMLEQLSNRANGNYSYIDSAAEAKKVLVDQLAGTLVTIAKDVKLQVEFNPAHVASYRLIGYENRKLAARDFNDDKKDAGEIGAGHQVTALYEWIPAGEDGDQLGGDVDPLKYQQQQPSAAAASGEVMTVKVRYKRPDESKSILLQTPVPAVTRRFGQSSGDFQFASAVASFGMLLRRSELRGDATYLSVWEIASSSLGQDQHGYRREFLELVRRAGQLDSQFPAEVPELSSDWKPSRPTPTQTALQVQHPVAPNFASNGEGAWAWCQRQIAATLQDRNRIFWAGSTFGVLCGIVIAVSCRFLQRRTHSAADALEESSVAPTNVPRKPVAD